MAYDRTAMQAKYFDRQRKRLLGEDAKLLLLRTSRDDEDTNEWELLTTVTTGWSADFSERFELPTFKVGRDDDEFGQLVADASQVVVIDSEKPALNGKVHEIDRAHTIPAGVAPYHRIRAEHKGKVYTA